MGLLSGIFLFLSRLGLAPFWQADRPTLPSTQESFVLTSTHILFQKATEANAFVADRPTPFHPGGENPFISHIQGTVVYLLLQSPRST
jgi:hypothetical protein